MAAKTKSVDSDVSEFYFRPELTIDPPLGDALATKLSNGWLKLQQVKDEDVVFDPTEGIKIVSNNITAVKGGVDPDDYQGDYPGFKKGVEVLVKQAADSGSVVAGQVIVRDANNNRFYRLIPDGNKVEVQAAQLGWPDGTQTPIPDGSGA